MKILIELGQLPDLLCWNFYIYLSHSLILYGKWLLCTIQYHVRLSLSVLVSGSILGFLPSDPLMPDTFCTLATKSYRIIHLGIQATALRSNTKAYREDC